MRAADRSVLLGLLIVGLAAAFWFMVLSPKREEVATLQDEIASVQSEVDQAEATVAAAEQAREDYEGNYRTVVTLGKAVPSDSDTPSLITQLQTIANRADVEFRALELMAGGGGDPATPTEQTTTDQNQSAPATEEAPASPVAAAPATETAAAALPLGASVGPAGLPVMPYELSFQGDFFEMADFLEGLDGLVKKSDDGALEVGGRLMTVNGFTMAPPTGSAKPILDMTLTMTTYVTPESQGLTAGATPAAPPPTDPAQPTPVAAPTGTVAP